MDLGDIGYEDYDWYGTDYNIYPDDYCADCGGECAEGVEANCE